MEKMKLKNWIEEHEDEIKAEGVRVLWYVLGFGVAWFVNGKLTTHKCVENVLDLRDAGLLRFTNPSTGAEITIQEAYNISKKMKL